MHTLVQGGDPGRCDQSIYPFLAVEEWVNKLADVA